MPFLRKEEKKSSNVSESIDDFLCDPSIVAEEEGRGCAEFIFVDRGHSLPAPATLLHGELLPRGFPPRLGPSELNHATYCLNEITSAIENYMENYRSSFSAIIFPSCE